MKAHKQLEKQLGELIRDSLCLKVETQLPSNLVGEMEISPVYDIPEAIRLRAELILFLKKGVKYE